MIVTGPVFLVIVTLTTATGLLLDDDPFWYKHPTNYVPLEEDLDADYHVFQDATLVLPTEDALLGATDLLLRYRRSPSIVGFVFDVDDKVILVQRPTSIVWGPQRVFRTSPENAQFYEQRPVLQLSDYFRERFYGFEKLEASFSRRVAFDLDRDCYVINTEAIELALTECERLPKCGGVLQGQCLLNVETVLRYQDNTKPFLVSASYDVQVFEKRYRRPIFVFIGDNLWLFICIWVVAIGAELWFVLKSTYNLPVQK
jgi:hypothetical protein